MHCSKTDGLRRQMQRADEAETRQHPGGEVRFIKAAFATPKFNQKQKKQRTACMAEVLFDSFLHTRFVGIRSVGKRIRQMLFRAGPYQVDVLIEAIPDAARLAVTGQLLNASDPEMVARETQVTLSNRRGKLLHLVTNEFGEFRGEIENSGDLELMLPSQGGKPIIISLRSALG